LKRYGWQIITFEPYTHEPGIVHFLVADNVFMSALNVWEPQADRMIGLFMRAMFPLFLGMYFLFFCVFFQGACSNSKDKGQDIQEYKKVVVRVKIPLQEIPVAGKKTDVKSVKVPLSDTKVDATMGTSAGLNLALEAQRDMNDMPCDGYYLVHKGDSLFEIAGRKGVYGNPLKWPTLFRLNMDKFVSIEISDDFEHKTLPEGLKLKFVTPQQARKNLSNQTDRLWVVSVLSTQDPRKVVSPAIVLMKLGYRVYITKAMVKGKEWIRLRVGFYKDKAGAISAMESIASVSTIPEAADAWVTRIGQSEFEEFGGY